MKEKKIEKIPQYRKKAIYYCKGNKLQCGYMDTFRELETWWRYDQKMKDNEEANKSK